ncbi:MAG: hypothetical protein JSV92_01870 [archaeon]|nr:MAG: hypothetical protein JSV92_01870 [archaeon]
MKTPKPIPLAIFIFIVLSATILGGEVLSNNPKTFSASPSPLRINWTNSFEGNLTLNVNATYSGALSVDNSTHTVCSNYSQPATGWAGSYDSSIESSTCGLTKASPSYTLDFFVKNATGYYTDTKNLNGESTWALLERELASCPPGRYWGLVDILNSSEPSHYATVEVEMNFPVSSENSFDTANGRGQFRGTIETDESAYHSYYFNTSELDNATSVTIDNLAIDAFLFGQSGFKSKNIIGSSELVYQYLPQDQWWEIRIFDNSSTNTYSGFLKFSTLAAVKPSSPSEKISLIEFGERNPSYKNTTNIRLKNEGNLTMSSVVQSSELYHTETETGSGKANFTFRVPAFVNSITALLEWTGASNYTVKLYKPDDTLVGTSDGEYLNANVSGVIQEEYVAYTPGGTIGTSDDGMWRVEILNNTAATGSYDLTLKTGTSTSGWVSTDYSATTFNSTGEYKDFDFNFTVQNATLSGLHNGSLYYESSLGAIIAIPFSVNVTAQELMANNSFYGSTVTLNENIGFNRTLVLNISVNNTGNEGLTLSSSSSPYLAHSSNYINLSYEAPATVPAGGSSLLNVTLGIDTTETNNEEGTYTGWIYLNDSDAHPYGSFNLTLQVVLSNDLDVYVTNISSAGNDATISNVSLDEDVIIVTEVYYKNGTSVDYSGLAGNFGFVRFRHQDYSITAKQRIIPDANLSENGGGFSRPPEYWINATWIADEKWPGGYYDVYITANDTADGHLLEGTGSGGNLTIAGPGLYFKITQSLKSTFTEVNEKDHVEVKVVNYGTVAVEDGDVGLDVGGDDEDDCEEVIDLTFENDTCGDYVNAGETCYYLWEVELRSDSDYVLDCSVDVETTENRYGSLPSETFRVSISDDSSTDSGTDSGGDETTDIDITESPSSLSIVQGESEEFDVGVENDGDTDQDDLELEITGIPFSWVSSTPSELDLDSGDEGEFKVNISVPSDAVVKSYPLDINVGNDDISDSKESTLKVLPSEESKLKINQSYDVYLENYTSLENKMKEMFGGGKNVTELNETLVQIKSKLDIMGGYIGDGDYFNAAQIEGEIESLLIKARDIASQEGKGVLGIMEETSSYVWLFIGVVIIIIAGFLIYMFMPPPTESYKIKKFKYVSPEAGSSLGNKIKKQLEKIKIKISELKPTKEKGKGYQWKKK